MHAHQLTPSARLGARKIPRLLVSYTSQLGPARVLVFCSKDFVFCCCGPESPTATTSGFLDGFSSAHSRVTGRLPLPPGWHFVGTQPFLRAGKTAIKKCVEASTFFSIFCHDFTFFAVCCIQQQCSAQREVSRATLYHPISSQTDYWQV